MPKKHKKNHHEQSKKMPVVFYHSIPTAKIFPEQQKEEEKLIDFSKRATQPDTAERQVWLYVGVGTVMAALLFFWGRNIPEMIKTAPAESAAQNLFEKNNNSLASLFEEQKKTSEEIKKTLINAANLFASSTIPLATSTPTTTTSAISTTSTPQLSAQQLKELKSKLKINKK